MEENNEEKEFYNCRICNTLTHKYDACFKCYSLMCPSCSYGSGLNGNDYYFCRDCKEVHIEEFVYKNFFY